MVHVVDVLKNEEYTQFFGTDEDFVLSESVLSDEELLRKLLLKITDPSKKDDYSDGNFYIEHTYENAQFIIDTFNHRKLPFSPVRTKQQWELLGYTVKKNQINDPFIKLLTLDDLKYTKEEQNVPGKLSGTVSPQENVVKISKGTLVQIPSDIINDNGLKVKLLNYYSKYQVDANPRSKFNLDLEFKAYKIPRTLSDNKNITKDVEEKLQKMIEHFDEDSYFFIDLLGLKKQNEDLLIAATLYSNLFVFFYNLSYYLNLKFITLEGFSNYPTITYIELLYINLTTALLCMHLIGLDYYDEWNQLIQKSKNSIKIIGKNETWQNNLSSIHLLQSIINDKKTPNLEYYTNTYEKIRLGEYGSDPF
jgi:hypothetical protein